MELILAVVFISAMVAVGPWFLNHWTDGHVPPSCTLLCLLLLVVVLNSFWSTSSTLVVAINQHQSLAAYYVLATGVTLGVTYFAAKDTLGEFLRSLLRAPPNLQIKDLFKRLRAPKSLNQG
jgi:hypothetical protein